MPDAGAPVLEVHIPQLAPVGRRWISIAPEWESGASSGVAGGLGQEGCLGSFFEDDNGSSEIGTVFGEGTQHVEGLIDDDAAGT